MKNNILIIMIIMIVTSGTILLVTNKNSSNEIPSNYIVVFRSETAETVYTTYLYKKKNKKYKYINTVSTSNGYDSISWNEKIIKKGSVKNKKDIFEIVNNNQSSLYVKYIKNNKVYSFEEFKDVWK